MASTPNPSPAHTAFLQEREARLAQYAADAEFHELSQRWLKESMERKYVYNFDWLGRPIIQYPQDMVAVQELVWQVQPDLIIETGIAHGGSLVLSASMLALLDVCDASQRNGVMAPRQSKRKVIGVDIDIREHNRAAIETHPLSSYIEMIQGSSVADDTVNEVRNRARGFERVMVFLDSMHTHEHVLAELKAYAPLVSTGSYCVVFDSFVEDMPPQFFSDRPWDVGNNPKTAIREWLREAPGFAIDPSWEQRLQVTVAPSGFLRRVS